MLLAKSILRIALFRYKSNEVIVDLDEVCVNFRSAKQNLAKHLCSTKQTYK
jgi:hypothetical protein